MLKRAAITAMALLALGTASSATAATVPAGPRLAVLRLSADPARSEIATLGPKGGGYQRLDASFAGRGSQLSSISIPAWSPDGSSVAFGPLGRGPRMISVVPAGGGPARPIPGTKGGFLPVFAPNGRSLAFARERHHHIAGEPSFVKFESTSVWMVDLETGVQRQLTRWRDNLDQYPSSFSPDGSTLLVTRVDQERGSDPEAVALRFDGRSSLMLIAEGAFPVYSPDGSEIAIFRSHGGGHDPGNDLYVIDADGANLRRLTHTPRAREIFASWDPSGKRIAYTSFRRDIFGPEGGAAVMEINADGSCPTKVRAAKRAAFIGPVWQPGPGRGAGPIAC